KTASSRKGLNSNKLMKIQAFKMHRIWKCENIKSILSSRTKVFNLKNMSGRIENLLEQANSSKANDASVNSAQKQFLSEAEAEGFFRQTRERLLNINEWNEHSTPSNFELF